MRKTKTRSNPLFLKIFLYCAMLTSLFSSVSIGFDQIRPATNPDNGIPLSKFIIDKWEPVKHPPEVIREIQFINENKIWYDVISSDDGYQDEATYQFVSDNTIEVQGRREATINKWTLSRMGTNLEICFQVNLCDVFARERIKWWWILITLTAAILAFYLSKKLTDER